MKQKYIIRETSVPFDPPYTPLYFHGFTTRGAGICMVFGDKLAQEYDTLEAVNKILVKVKELSGRDTWEVYPKFKVEVEKTKFNPEGNFFAVACGNCGLPASMHGIFNDCPEPK